MKSKKKKEMEKAQNTMGAAQELDMDDLEDVAGGYVSLIKYTRLDADGTVEGAEYGVVDDNGKLVKKFSSKAAAERYNKNMGYATGKKGACNWQKK